jgi:hypothetical protein
MRSNSLVKYDQMSKWFIFGLIFQSNKPWYLVIKSDVLLELNWNANEIYVPNFSLGTPRYVTKPPMPN